MPGDDGPYEYRDRFNYDANGNRVDNNNGQTYSVGNANQTTSDGTYTYTYDGEGNLITKQKHHDLYIYTYDYRNRLQSVQYQDASEPQSDYFWKIVYKYDAFDRLIDKRIDSDGNGTFDHRDLFVYDGNQVVLHFATTTGGVLGAAQLKDRYLWGPAVDMLLADERLTVNNTIAGTVDWALTDNQNTVRDVVEYNSGTG